MLVVALLSSLLLAFANGQPPAPAATDIPDLGLPQSFGYLLAYDALNAVYNAYKYGVPFSGLQVPFPDPLVYVACMTLAANPADNIIYLHPTFPIGSRIGDLTAGKFPLAIHFATAVNEQAHLYLGDRVLLQADFPYGPYGEGSQPAFKQSVLGFTIYGTLNDTGSIFTCSSGTQAVPL